MKTDYLAYRCLTQLQDRILEIQLLINPNLEISGVVATLYDTRMMDDRVSLYLIKKEYHLLGIIRAVAKKDCIMGYLF